MDSPRPPTAVIAANDVCAFGAMRALQTRGLQAGRDGSVVGFDDIRLASHWYPALTTLRQPLRRIGSLVTQILTAVIAGDAVEQQVMFEPQLIGRHSTSPLKKAPQAG